VTVQNAKELARTAQKTIDAVHQEANQKEVLNLKAHQEEIDNEVI
jgi:hypothetical protein